MDQSRTMQPLDEESECDIDQKQAMAFLARIRAQTPARVLTGRAGAAYRTATWLELRRDHAVARDAVAREFDLNNDLGSEFTAEWRLFQVNTLALTKRDYLLRPELGRMLDAPGRADICLRCPPKAQLQVAIADGLSAAALRAQVPAVLPLLAAAARGRGWHFGQPFYIHHGRVGVLNDIGDLLDPFVVVLLIGERPGLATAESLSAYMGYRPRSGHDDSQRNLISNIHSRGIPSEQAAMRITALAAQMMRTETSGITVKEEWAPGESWQRAI